MLELIHPKKERVLVFGCRGGTELFHCAEELLYRERTPAVMLELGQTTSINAISAIGIRKIRCFVIVMLLEDRKNQ